MPEKKFDVGDILNERYELMEKVSRGTMGNSIWSATDNLMDRLVAVEIFREHNPDEHEFDPYIQTMQASRMIHPNILPIYDAGVETMVRYSVTALAHKTTLSDLVKKPLETKLADLLRIFQQIADVIDFMHKMNIIHNDIKSTQIWLNENHHVYLRDLSFATFKELTPDMVGHVFGTPYYMAPERWLLMYGEEVPIDISSDIYSFGIVMFEVLTGQFPFSGGQSILRFAEQHMNEDFPSVHSLRPELPIGIDIVLQRLCAKSPEDRYSTATEAVDDMYKSFYSGQGNIEGKIFISYARKDSEYVHKLADELRRIGLDLWIDRDIEPGSNWDEAIENGLNDCDMMLLITTDASMSSEYVTHEWSYFMGGGKPVYPFIPQTPIPQNVHPRLSRVQHVVGTDDMLNNVARIVDVLAGGTPTKLGSSDT